MLTIVGTILILGSAVYSGYLLRGASGLLVVYFLLATTVAGIAVASLARTSALRAGTHDADVANDLKKKIDTFSRLEQQTEARIQEKQQVLEKAQGQLREAYRAIFTTLFYSALMHDVIPMPPSIQDQIAKGLDEIARLAYPDEGERADAIRKITKDIAMAQPAHLPMPKSSSSASVK